jgi:PTH1 family peptidyl-tRNA hydrolase
VAQLLGTENYARLRVGVGRGDIQDTDGRLVGRPGMSDHVLGRFRPDERDTISAAVLRAADASEVFIAEGIGRVMNAFNADVKDGTQDPDPAP